MKPPSVRRFPGRPAGQGFTLVELLVLLAILVAVAGLAAGMYYEAGEAATEDLARAQMAELAKAIQAFKRDTGYYPRTGPFALDVDYAGTGNTYGHIDGTGWTQARRNHFYSPANLEQLFVRPVLGSTANSAQSFLQSYDPATRRGWNGPYLRANAAALLFVDVGDGLAPDGSGDPAAGTAIIDVLSVGAPRELPPVAVGSYARCATAPGPADCLLDYRKLPSTSTYPLYDPAVHQLQAHGRPYLLVVEPPGTPAQLIYLGADGCYSGGTCAADNIVVSLEP